MADRTIGIDLGTTNSVVAATDEGGEPRVLPDEHDEKIHPSVVSFHPNGTVIVGAVAKQRRVIDPKNTVFSVKRLIGRTYNSPEVQAAIKRMPFKITEGPNEQPIIHTRGGQFAIPELSAIVLDHMRAIAKRARRAETTKTVITVPANFNEGQRSATATAGAIAGLEVIRVLNEPTAAAIAYGHRRKLDQLIAVYDFGGGTFDVSILSVKDQVFEVVATAGNTFLGGDDIDETLVDHMVDLFLRQENVDLRADDLAMQRLRSVAEQIKIQLSRRSRAIVKIDEIAYGPGGRGLDLNLEITREELVARCAFVVDKTFPVCDEALKLAGINREIITDVVLVGGTTKMPYVRQRATQYFGKQPRVDVNPDEAVALGAAIQANIIAMEIAGELSYRRVGSVDTSSEVTRVDPNVSARVASMLRQSQQARAQGPSKSIIVEEPTGDGDTDLEFGDDYTDGSGIFVSVEPSDLDTETRSAEPETNTDTAPSEDSLTATDRGWDAGEAWGGDSAWQTFPMSEDEQTGTSPKQSTVTKADTLRQFAATSRDTDKGVPLPPRIPVGDEEATVTRARDSQPQPPPLGKPLSTKPLPMPIPPATPRPTPIAALAPTPNAPTEAPTGRTTNKMPPPIPRADSEPTFSEPPSAVPPLPPPPLPMPPRPAQPAPLELMPEPPSAPAGLVAPPSARTLYDASPGAALPPPASPSMQPRPAQPPPPRSSVPPPRTAMQPPPPLPPPPVSAAPLVAAPSARTLYEPPVAPRPFTAPPDAPAGLGLDHDDYRRTEPRPTPSPARPALVSQYGLPELGSQPFQSPIIKDVTSYTLGIGTVSGYCEALIARNTQIPHSIRKSFSTSKDGQTVVRIKVFQGESRRLDENSRLGDLVLENLPPRPRGETTIDVTFKLNASGMLDVHAVDQATGYQQQASLEIRGMQSRDEVAASQNRLQGILQ